MHIATTVVLFITLWRMTNAVAPSGLVAALFAVHPLHVESVAWISERKDVLNLTLFWALTLWTYTAYVRDPKRVRLLAVCGMFLCALLAKPMVVTLPFVLLLIDIWPLGRMPLDWGAFRRHGRSTTVGRLVREKLPLFMLAVASSIVTFRAASRRRGRRV